MSGRDFGRSAWDEAFPGVDVWRAEYVGEEGAIAERERTMLSNARDAFDTPGHLDRYALERVFLYGSFPATEVVILFEAGCGAGKCRFGYSIAVWEHPDTVQIALVNCAEHVVDFLGGRESEALREFGCDHGEVIWVSDAPGVAYGGPRMRSES